MLVHRTEVGKRGLGGGVSRDFLVNQADSRGGLCCPSQVDHTKRATGTFDSEVGSMAMGLPVSSPPSLTGL